MCDEIDSVRQPNMLTENTIRLKILGTTIKNLEDTLDVVALVSDFRKQEEAMRVALSLSDYGTVAKHAASCCDILQKKVLCEERSRFSAKRLGLFEQVLQTVRKALKALIPTKDLAVICDLVNVLPLLNSQEEGVDFMSQRIRDSLLSSIAESATENRSMSKRVTLVLSQASQLVDKVCCSLSQHYDCVSIQRFVNESCKHLAGITAEVAGEFTYENEVEDIDEANIGELILTSRACSIFWWELSSRMRNIFTNQVQIDSNFGWYDDGSDKLMSMYMAAEVRLLRSHYRRAIAETLCSTSCKVSSVHDIFYVMRRSFERAYISTWAQALKSVLEEITRILSEMFDDIERTVKMPAKEVFVSSLPDLGARILTDVELFDQLIERPEMSQRIHMALLSETVMAFSASFLTNAKSLIHDGTYKRGNQNCSMDDCLHSLDSITVAFSKLSSELMAALAQDLLNVMKQVTNEISLTQYVLSGEQFESINVKESWVEPLLWFFELFSKRIENYCEEAGDWVTKLIHVLIKRITLVLEMTMFNYLRFNQLGSLVFERQVRALILGLSNLSQPNTRAEFSRLLSACRLLSLDHVHDVADYFDNSSGLILELNINEVTQVLCLRDDFSETNIREILDNLFMEPR